MKIQKFCKWLVVVLFLAMIFGVCIGTVAVSGHKLYESVTKHALTDQYMGENPTIADRIQARFLSFENMVNQYLFGREAGLTLNIKLEEVMGRQILQFGDDKMVTLSTGHFYDLVDYTDVSEQVQNVIDDCDEYFSDVPVLYVYAQSTLYDEAMLPEGVQMLDHNFELAEEIIDALEGAGLEVMDSRDVLNNSGYPLEELLMYTDQHWSSKAALVMAGEIAGYLEAQGVPVQADNLDMENFETQTFEDNFLGKYGQRVGASNSHLDDMTAFWPSYETDIRRITRRGNTLEADVQGSFKDVAIRWEKFENDKNCNYSTESYKAYGLTEGEEFYINENVAEGKILVIKDSFGASVNSFLSLCAHEVRGIDLRHCSGTLEDYLAEYQPDAVVYVYSQQILRDFAAQ